jgi:hypothetical protein
MCWTEAKKGKEGGEGQNEFALPNGSFKFEKIDVGFLKESLRPTTISRIVREQLLVSCLFQGLKGA